MLRYVNNYTSDYAIGFRKNGSTDNRGAFLYRGSQMMCAVGVDANRIFEAYVQDTTRIDIYLVGYFESEAVFNTNAADKSLADTLTWTDIDISGDTGANTAIGAIFEIISTGSYDYGFRVNGSTDDRKGDVVRHCGAIIGVDGSEICEGYIQNAGNDFFLVGYIKSGATFITNATDMSLASTGDWYDLDALPEGATGGFFQVPCPRQFFDMREKGSADDFYAYKGEQFPNMFIKCDANRIIQGKIAATSVDFFLVGYATASTPAVTARRIIINFI
jgi:hypothetical protein